MATCPVCKTRDGVENTETGETHLQAKPVGDFALAGVQMKFSAVGWPVLLLSHPCGFRVRVVHGGDAYYAIEQPTMPEAPDAA